MPNAWIYITSQSKQENLILSLTFTEYNFKIALNGEGGMIYICISGFSLTILKYEIYFKNNWFQQKLDLQNTNILISIPSSRQLKSLFQPWLWMAKIHCYSRLLGWWKHDWTMLCYPRRSHSLQWYLVQHCHTYTWSRLNNIVEYYEKCGQHNIDQSCFYQPWTHDKIFAVYITSICCH